MSHLHTDTLRNTSLIAGNARARGRSIAHGTRSPRKVGIIGGGKRLKSGTGARGTRGAVAGARARGRRDTRATGDGVHVVRVQGQAGGRGPVGRARVVQRAGRDGHV